jgi:hypothetical protein
MNQRLSVEQPSCGGHGPIQTEAARSAQAALVETFLRHALASGAISVPELEERARSAGLLGERSRIGDAKRFKSAKKRLGIVSRRDGFGRGGEWFWQLSALPSTPTTDSLPDLVVSVSAVDDGDRSRPSISASSELPGPDPYRTPDDGAPMRRIPPNWVRGVAVLQRRPRPSGFPQHRWRLFLEDCVRFLAGPWAERAAEMGWDSTSLFGCRFGRPHEHLGNSGLLWNLAGGEILRLHKDGAIIRAKDEQRTFQRRPSWMTSALPWD